MVWQICW